MLVTRRADSRARRPAEYSTQRILMHRLDAGAYLWLRRSAWKDNVSMWSFWSRHALRVDRFDLRVVLKGAVLPSKTGFP
jgi:hypothetical protein